jgi:hypothetical protein
MMSKYYYNPLSIMQVDEQRDKPGLGMKYVSAVRSVGLTPTFPPKSAQVRPLRPAFAGLVMHLSDCTDNLRLLASLESKAINRLQFLSIRIC